MILTIALGIVLAVIILAVLGAIAQERPGCALWIVAAIVLFAIVRCASGQRPPILSSRWV